MQIDLCAPGLLEFGFGEKGELGKLSQTLHDATFTHIYLPNMRNVVLFSLHGECNHVFLPLRFYMMVSPGYTLWLAWHGQPTKRVLVSGSKARAWRNVWR